MTSTIDERLRNRFSYDWRTQEVAFGGPDLVDTLSVMSRALFAMSLDRAPTQTLNYMYNFLWRHDAEVMRHWRCMKLAEKVEALTVAVAEVHETTHHVDFLCTPFAVTLHTRTMREYWGLQYFAPLLIEQPELLPGRLIEFEMHAENLNLPADHLARRLWPDVWLPLRALLAFGDGSGVWPHGGIEIGWGSNREPYPVLGQPFEKIWVNGILGTVRRPGNTDWYLRPLTFFRFSAPRGRRSGSRC
jgi:hypothetical protein